MGYYEIWVDIWSNLRFTSIIPNNTYRPYFYSKSESGSWITGNIMSKLQFPILITSIYYKVLCITICRIRVEILHCKNSTVDNFYNVNTNRSYKFS